MKTYTHHCDWQFLLELIWEPVTFPVVHFSDSDCNIAMLAKCVTSPFPRQLRGGGNVLEASPGWECGWGVI
jgi:hypothetical protein